MIGKTFSTIPAWATRRAVLAAALAAALGAGAHAQEAQPSQAAPGAHSVAHSVAVTAIVEHPALDAVRDGAKEALEQAGFSGERLRWQYQSAQGNTATAAQIARKFIGEKPAVIIAIATPSAQAVVAATKDIPVVYAAVTDPVAAQLVKSWEAGGGNVTGVSDALELEEQIALIKKIVPGARRVGIVYNPGEANSNAVAEKLKGVLPRHGMELVESSAPRTVDVTAAARKLAGKVDVIYTNTDNNVISAYEALAKVANEAKIPLIASDTEAVRRGAVAALGVDYRVIGRQAGELAARILKGEKPGEIASQRAASLELFVSKKAAAAQGVTLPAQLIESAKEVIE